MERLHKDLRELLGLFRSYGVEYLVVGGHAVAFHGYPRYTQDIDCFVRPTASNGERIIRALTDFGFGSPGLVAEDFAGDDRMIQLGRAPNRVDLLTRLYGVEFESAWAGKVAGTIDSVPVWFISRADLLSNKRATARPQGLADVARIEQVESAD